MNNRTKLKERLTTEQFTECHALIHGASVAAAGVGTGLAQIPLSDTVVITTIQVGMIVALGRVFGIEVTESMAKAAISTAIVATTGRTISQVLIGWIPGLGNVVNASTAAALTECIGWAMVDDFTKEM